MCAGASVSTDPREIGFIGVPISVALVMVWNEYGPLFSWQFADTLLASAGSVENNFMATLAVHIGACVDWISEHMIDGNIGRLDPTDAAIVALQRKGQTFAAEPKPDAAYRSEFGKASKHHTDRGANRFIWMEAHLAVSLPPDEADRKATTEFAPSRLVADATK